MLGKIIDKFTGDDKTKAEELLETLFNDSNNDLTVSKIINLIEKEGKEKEVENYKSQKYKAKL